MNLEEIQHKIQQHLQQNGIKLWLSPFTNEADLAVENEIEKLSENVSENLNLDKTTCLQTLHHFRVKSLENLKCRSHYEKTQEATLKIKLPTEEAKNRGVDCQLNIRCVLPNTTGRMLYEDVAKQLSVQMDLLKLIGNGHLIKYENSLVDCGLKNGSCLMLLISNVQTKQNEEEIKEENSQTEKKMMMNEVNTVIDYLAQRAVDGLFYHEDMQLDILDQDGSPMKLNPEDKSNIVKGLGFQKWGKSLLDIQDYQNSLILLLLAEESLNATPTVRQITSSTDNIAEIQLDIVWIFLQLQRTTELPDAKRRLAMAQEGINRTYHHKKSISLKNLARKNLLDLRLLILQSYCHFYDNDNQTAKATAIKAVNLFQQCKIKTDCLVEMLSMGMNEHEAKFSLFVCNNNLQHGIQFIYDERENMKEMKKKEEKMEESEYFDKKFGKTWNGNSIDIGCLNQMKSMGFDSALSLQALRESDNNLETAISLLTENSSKLEEHISSCQEYGLDTSGNTQYVTMAQRKQLATTLSDQMNVKYYTAYNALKDNQWNEDLAREQLLNKFPSTSSDTLNDTLVTNSSKKKSSSMDKDKKEIENLIRKHFRMRNENIYPSMSKRELDLIEEEMALQRLAVMVGIEFNTSIG